MNKVDYKKYWDNDGYVYNQTITINKNMMERFNYYIMEKKLEIDKKYLKTRHFSEKDLKIKSINYLDKGINYCNLIQLELFLNYYFNKVYDPHLDDKFYKRLKYRNTIIYVKEI